tara:strand:+ start:31 stop:513 length:483 start_codon:yes stop_codon:yes gene_type:complete
MRYIGFLIVFTLIALLAWPYIYVYRLDQALAANDVAAMNRLVDLEAVRAQVKKDFSKEVSNTVGADGGRVMRWLKEGLKLVSDTAIDANIDMPWVINTLNTRPGDPTVPRPSFMGDISYAFFESYDEFLIRLGELGANAMHVQLELQEDDTWRVVAIYGG